MITYINKMNIEAKKTELWNEISAIAPQKITKEQIAYIYNCSVDDLTIENFEEIREELKEYIKVQEEYNTIYTNEIINQKEKCEKLIQDTVFVDGIFATNVRNNTKYNFSPISIYSEPCIIAKLDTDTQTISKIGMTICYNIRITQFTVDATKMYNNSHRYIYNGTMTVCAEVDLSTNEVLLYYISALNSYGASIWNDGSSVDWIYQYTEPFAYNLYESNDPYTYEYVIGEEKNSSDDKENSSSNENITGIEQAIKDGVLDSSIYTNGIKVEEVQRLYYDGKLKPYYKVIDEFYVDALKLNIPVIIEKQLKPIREGLTGIEQAIEDKMIEDDYITNGVSEEWLHFAYSDGNLNLYYNSWEECLEDAKKLNILREPTEEELDSLRNMP